MAEDKLSSDAWYTYPGSNDDVVLSIRSRLARNLANFPFPPKMQDSDGAMVQAIVFDAFNHLSDAEAYRAIPVANLDAVGARIMEERGVLPSVRSPHAGLIIRNDGRVSCTVNLTDHVRISSFCPGFDLDKVIVPTRKLDEALQAKVQFAASYDFGYLTSSVYSSGSGMRLSVRVHLPSLTLQNKIASVSKDFASKGISFTACYGAGNQGGSLGCFYQLSTNNSSSGTEFDQFANLVSEIEKLIDAERTAREEVKRTNLSDIRNTTYRSLALAKNSIFVSLKESIELVSGMKFALDCGYLEGMADTVLHALLYRVQEGQLQYVEKNGNFSFENDIVSDPVKKQERLRALLLQEAVDDVVLNL